MFGVCFSLNLVVLAWNLLTVLYLYRSTTSSLWGIVLVSTYINLADRGYLIRIQHPLVRTKVCDIHLISSTRAWLYALPRHKPLSVPRRSFRTLEC